MANRGRGGRFTDEVAAPTLGRSTKARWKYRHGDARDDEFPRLRPPMVHYLDPDDPGVQACRYDRKVKALVHLDGTPVLPSEVHPQDWCGICMHNGKP